jgi:zinc/manganese transport system permease protein
MPADPTPAFRWDLIADVDQMLRFPFMVNAFRAGAVVAVLAGVVGWFMVLRRQSFAGHTFAVVSFPGAAGAALVGVSATYGLFAFALAAAVVIAVVPVGSGRAYREESAVTGTVQSFALAAGYLFVSLYGGFLGGVDALLFGSFLGITQGDVLTLLVTAVSTLLVLAVVGRPLLFGSVDPDVAAARRVPVRGLALAYLVVLALAAAEVSRITGALLVFTLLVAPAAAAQQLSANPSVSIPVSVVIAVVITWLSLTVGYFTEYPIGFSLSTFGLAAYLAATLWRRRGRRPRLVARLG